MAWDQLAINKPHLAYIILGGFTSLFMLCSLFVKERLYIGEATVATICGIIFGPHAANLFSPNTWGNVDQITLECSRIVLVVQCFAVGVELPKAYMERHWRSVVFLLVPVMTFGWLITSLFIWWMVPPLSWLESLVCAACVTATDPVLASSVVGKGKFAKRVPKHLRDLLSAESGCNDGMAFPFIYLALYLVRYRPDANKVAEHWICLTILYECIFGAIYGVAVGYAGRHAIKWAENRNMIDRESFLVFYFTLALFCAGSGSILGIDDLLVGFAAGVGFSNDGWFLQKTEESHVSNVIDLLLNLAYFVYLGSIIPWELYNAPSLGLTPWRLVVIAIFVILFRRIPIMMALKPLIPDIKTWREALFAGHFGPIGVGAIFVAIMARAELETEGTTPLAELPAPGTQNYLIVEVIWPITTFLVIASIVVHGSSIAVFTLGKRINTLTLTMSYTQANEEGPSWMERLPRIQSRSKSSMSLRRPDTAESGEEKQYPPGMLPPIGMPGQFLRRQKEEDESRPGSRSPSVRSHSRKKKWESMGPGGPISQSAIAPQRQKEAASASGSETLAEKGEVEGERSEAKREEEQGEFQAYQEGANIIVEDKEGNVIDEERTSPGEGPGSEAQERFQHLEKEGKEVGHELSHELKESASHPEKLKEGLKEAADHPAHPYRNLRKKLVREGTWRHRGEESPSKPKTAKTAAPKSGPALAYQFGNTIIVEDENGEVVKKYDIPAPQKKAAQQKAQSAPHPQPRRQLTRMGTWLGGKDGAEAGPSGTQASDAKRKKKAEQEAADDARIRFTIASGGQRLGKEDFIKQVQKLDPKARAEAVEATDAPDSLKREVQRQAREERIREAPPQDQEAARLNQERSPEQVAETGAQIKKVGSNESHPAGPEGLALVDSEERAIPYHSVTEDLARLAQPDARPTAAQLRRQQASSSQSPEESRERGRARTAQHDAEAPEEEEEEGEVDDQAETAVERRRREAALGLRKEENDSDSEDEGTERMPPQRVRWQQDEEPVPGRRRDGGGDGHQSRRSGMGNLRIRFA